MSHYWSAGDELTAEKLNKTGTIFGGDGSDGALSISSGTITLDLESNTIFIKNYTSISITGTGKLSFSNPHNNGTIIILRSQGDVVLTSTANPCIDISGIGAAGAPASSGSVSSSGGGGGMVMILYRSLINNSGIINCNGGASIGTLTNCQVTGGTTRGNDGQMFTYMYKNYTPPKGGTTTDMYVGGGGSYYAAGGNGEALTMNNLINTITIHRGAFLFTGAGGGGTSRGAGGRGGGCLVIECDEGLNFTGQILAKGQDGIGGCGNGGSGGTGLSMVLPYPF